MPLYEEYRAIVRRYTHRECAPSLVAVHPDDPTCLHWLGGPSSSRLTEGVHYTTLRVYRVADFLPTPPPPDARDCAQDAIEIAFYREFYPKKAGPVRAGPAWIAPDGGFYPVSYEEHDRQARLLCASLYGRLGGPADLESRGWLRLLAVGAIMWRSRDETGCLTQAQLDTLQDLYGATTGAFHEEIGVDLQIAEVRV